MSNVPAPNVYQHPTQALIQRVTEEVEAESGVELDQLINPAKVHTAVFQRIVAKKVDGCTYERPA